MIPAADEALTEVFRRESPLVLSALVRLSGDLDQAEDALQEALAVASANWKEQGVPDNPGGWIMTTAKRRLVDQFRRSRVGRTKQQLASLDTNDDPNFVVDDRLALLFTCCHPALSLESRVSLTLRTICGLTTEEIALAFLVPTPTMAQRIVRAKSKIRISRIPYEIPDPDHWNQRLSAVLACVYLTFNQGYNIDHERRGVDLANTALELGRLLDLMVPREPEIEGLLALMMLTNARRGARTAGDGTIVLLEDQDRRLWDATSIDEAVALILAAAGHGSVGQYWLQAAIAAEHIAPATFADRDWTAIVGLYDKLLLQTGNSPVVRLNRALAVAHMADPATALAELDTLGDVLDNYPPYHSSRGHLLKQLDDGQEAADAYRRALSLTEAGPLRESLLGVLGKIETD